MQNVFTTNPHFDSILLVDDDDRVLSVWHVDALMVRFYLENGMDPLRVEAELAENTRTGADSPVCIEYRATYPPSIAFFAISRSSILNRFQISEAFYCPR